MKKIVVFAATSAIAKSIIIDLHKKYVNAIFFLVGKDRVKLEQDANDLKIRYQINSTIHEVNFTDFSMHQNLLTEIINKANDIIDIAIFAQGTLTNQSKSEKDFNYFKSEFELNFLSVVSFSHLIANHMTEQKKGTIVFISSVAGLRGRISNYSYGSSKSALNSYASGLRARLHSFNVHVLTVLPGFIKTPMTKELKKNALWFTPEQIAPSIVKAIDQKKEILYTPFFWRFIMFMIIHIPESIFKKLKL